MKLIPHSLTAVEHLHGIRSLSDVAKMIVPLNQTVALPPTSTQCDAAPKCLSGRTSYHGVCLAFHPYPQLIPSVFNLSGFAPPQPLTAASHWPWVDHPASGPGHATNNTQLGFAFATTTPHGLTSRHAADSQAHSSKGTPSHNKRCSDGL